MSITFTNEEWERHVSNIDSYRFAMQSLMEKVVTDHVGADAARGIFIDFKMNYNHHVDLLSPISGTELKIAKP